MTDLKAAFEAWVQDEYAPDGNVSWVDGPGLPDPPVIAQDGRVSSLDDVWTAYQAAHAAAIEAAAGVCPVDENAPYLADRIHPADDADRAAHKAWEDKTYWPADNEWDVLKRPRQYDLSDVHECGWLAWRAGAGYAMKRWRLWCAQQIRALAEKEARHGN